MCMRHNFLTVSFGSAIFVRMIMPACGPNSNARIQTKSARSSRPASSRRSTEPIRPLTIQIYGPADGASDDGPAEEAPSTSIAAEPSSSSAAAASSPSATAASMHSSPSSLGAGFACACIYRCVYIYIYISGSAWFNRWCSLKGLVVDVRH
ncbi:hypothetical protein T492DRAFT_27123 [Pavlovales sp. CCMP2436]|nr:hypothetical protein T492DRAFT_27123 [Pavlovales sp. CCMP2436]